MAVDRKRQVLLGGLAIALAFFIYRAWASPSGAPLSASNGSVTATAALGSANGISAQRPPRTSTSRSSRRNGRSPVRRSGTCSGSSRNRRHRRRHGRAGRRARRTFAGRGARRSAAAAAAAADHAEVHRADRARGRGAEDRGADRRQGVARLRERRGYHPGSVPVDPNWRRIGRAVVPRRPRPADDPAVGRLERQKAEGKGRKRLTCLPSSSRRSSIDQSAEGCRCPVGACPARGRLCGRAGVPPGRRSHPGGRSRSGRRRVSARRSGRPRQSTLQDRARAGDAGGVASAPGSGPRVRAAGSARSGARRVQAGERVRPDQPRAGDQGGVARQDPARSRRSGPAPPRRPAAARTGARRGRRAGAQSDRALPADHQQHVAPGHAQLHRQSDRHQRDLRPRRDGSRRSP